MSVIALWVTSSSDNIKKKKEPEQYTLNYTGGLEEIGLV